MFAAATTAAPEDGDDSGAQFLNAALPKLPVPPLEQTLERYLAAVRPLVGDAQFDRTRAMVKTFGSPGGVGSRLQDRLLLRQEEFDNWVYDWWMGDMYLNNPLPLPINSNPGMVLPPRSFAAPVDEARFAARMVAGVVAHKEMLDRRALPVERAASREKGQPLCMSQYYRLLTSYRAPGRARDSLLSTLLEDGSVPAEEQLVVMCANQMYVVPVKTADGGVVSEAELCAQFLHILNEAVVLPSPPPVGLLTAERRDVWAAAREALAREEQNALNLRLLESCLMVVCLDDPLPASFNSRALRSDVRGHVVGARDETNMAHQMIHGGGSVYNSANRWFDKTVQLVVSRDGVCGLCYEHSPSEGVAVVQLLEDVLSKGDGLPASVLAPVQPPSSPPQRLEWVLDSGTRRSILDAAHHLDCMVEDLDFFVYRFVGYGKEFIKSCRVSPDVYIQLALQLAYFRLHQQPVATYESASTRRFLLGRVDCIRSATSEALQWVAAMCQEEPAPGTDSEEDLLQAGKRVTFSLYDEQKKLELFEMAVKRQTDIMVQNILGQGIDIHLLGLREMAKDLGEPLPEIFQDETYKIANHFGLSTSQVGTKSDSFMGYGPVVPDGYGASYNPRTESIVFCLSAFHSYENTSTWRLAHSLDESLRTMQQLLASRTGSLP